MKLFHETENKYYELLSYMLQRKDNYSTNDIAEYLSSHLIGEVDYEVVDTLFSKKTGEEAIYSYSDGIYSAVLNMPFSIISLSKEKTGCHVGKTQRAWCKLDFGVAD